MRPNAIVIMYLPTCAITPKPTLPTAVTMSPKTPIGRNRITTPVSFIIASKAEAKKSLRVVPPFPCIVPIVAPKKMQKKIRPRMSMEAAASIGLSGIIRMMISAREAGRLQVLRSDLLDTRSLEASARLDEIAKGQPQQDGRQARRRVVDDRLRAEPTEAPSVPDRGHSAHDGSEDQRHDDHAHQTHEDLTQGHNERNRTEERGKRRT